MTFYGVAETRETAKQFAVFHRELHSARVPAGRRRLRDLLGPGAPASVWCAARLPGEVAGRARAVHEAAHAVLAWALGMTVRRVSVTRDRSRLVGGNTSVESLRVDAQHHAVVWLGGSYAQADWLAGRGFVHPELRRCVLGAEAYADLLLLDRITADGFLIDTEQAAADARRVLAEPYMAGAVGALADLLCAEGELDGEQVTALLQECSLAWPPDTGAPKVWVPGPRLPVVPEHPCRCAPSGAAGVPDL